MAFRKIVGSYKDYTLGTHIIEAGYLAVDTVSGDLRIGDGSTPGGTLLASGSVSQAGAITFYGTKLTSPSNGPIELVPGGTGNVLFPSLQFHDNEISARNSNEDLILTGSGTGKVQLSGLVYPSSDGDAGQFITTDGSGNLSFATVSVGDFSFVGSTIISPTNADITLDPSGSGAIALNANTTITGNLNVTGTQTTLETTTLVVEDPLLELAKNNSGGIANTMDQGLFFNRGSLSNVSLIWDESADEFAMAVTAGEDGTTSGNVTIDSYAGLRVGTLKAGGLTYPTSDGSPSQFLKTNGSGTLSFASVTLGDFSFIGSTIATPSNADLTLSPGGTGNVVAGAITINGTTISAADSTKITLAEAVDITGAVSITSGTITGITDLTVADGGTGASSHTANAILLGNSASAIQSSSITISGTTLATGDSSTININEGVNVDGTLITSGALTASGLAYPTSDGDAGQFLKTDGAGTLSFATVSIGDLSIIGATIAAPSNAPLTLVSSGSSVDIEGLSVTGNVISTTDSSAGVEITGNLIPSADGVYQLGSQTRRWQTAYLSAETLDIGGATISSDGTGSISIAATGATLPASSKVGTRIISLNGSTAGTAARPVQEVPLYVQDGEGNVDTGGAVAITFEFNGTIEDIPVYTEAGQTFVLSTGSTFASSDAGITQFQF